MWWILKRDPAARVRRALTNANASALRVLNGSGELAFGIKRGASDHLNAAIALLFSWQNPADFE